MTSLMCSLEVTPEYLTSMHCILFFQVFISTSFSISYSHPVPVFLLCVLKISSFFSYPTNMQYIEMVKSLFQRFKSLTKESVSYSDAVAYWHGRQKKNILKVNHPAAEYPRNCTKATILWEAKIKCRQVS